jgi:uroporphyrin-3 C-methyltransferase
MTGMNEPVAPSTDTPAPRSAPAASREAAPHGGSIALALLLALLALLAALYVGWRQWQGRQGRASDAQSIQVLRQKVGALEGELARVGGGHASLAQRLDAVDQLGRGLQASQQAQDDRLRLLEEAVGKLSETTLSARDAALLDETESLLRMGKARYELFHDAQGAAAAYALASQTLASVTDGAFAALQQSVEVERHALLATQPMAQADAAARVAALRDRLPVLPLKPLDAATDAPATGAWARIAHALGGVVSVQRDDGAPLLAADARFARELVALDLAQAQAALLAHDAAAWVAALQRADAGLASQFDTHDAAVQQARATLKQLLDAAPRNAPVPLGAALAELRNLRAVHALTGNPAPAASVAPAPGKGAAR